MSSIKKEPKRKQKFISLEVKLSLCIILAVLIPVLAITSVFFGKLYDMVIADSVARGQEISFEVAPNIEEFVSQLTDETMEIQNQSLFKLIFNLPIYRNWDEILEGEEVRDMDLYLQEFVESTPFTAVRFYMDRNDQAFNEAGEKPDFMATDYEVHSVYWHGIFAGKPTLRMYCPPDYLSQKERDTYGDSAIIYRRTYYYHGDVRIAYLAFYYSSDMLDQMLLPETSIPGTVSYIIDDRDTIVATTSKEKQGLYRMRYDTVEEHLLSSNSFQERNINDENVYVAVNRIESQNWYLVSIIPKAPLIQMANSMLLQFVIIVILCVTVAVAIGIGQAGSIVRRIQGVARQMEKVHLGPPEPMPEPTIHDEVGNLVDSYNYMTHEMNELIEQQKKTAEELRIAEFNILQAQINPHFLFNTMDMINWMAVQGKNEEVSETVQNLARFYKLTLSRKQGDTTIQNELEHARTYMELQNRRFQNAIDYVEDVPDELMEYHIPRLTFQPILENSIHHGILEKEDKTGTILITAWSEDEDICILISDDGVGMTEAVRTHLLDPEAREHRTKGTNIAVVNIHNRLRILYGEKYGLSYASTEGEGCEVTIRIPKQLEDTSFRKEI